MTPDSPHPPKLPDRRVYITVGMAVDRAAWDALDRDVRRVVGLDVRGTVAGPVHWTVGQAVREEVRRGL